MSDNFDDEFYYLIKVRIANTCIGPSTLRRQGIPGIKGEEAIIGITRKFLKEKIELDVFFYCLKEKIEYLKALNNWTLELEKLYEKAAPDNWGAARKSLNLFFRDIVYNKFLCEKYRLHITKNDYNTAIEHLEIPLDRNVAEKIIKNKTERIINLTRWNGIINLNKEESDKYQSEAINIAKKIKTVPIHLDLIFWK